MKGQVFRAAIGVFVLLLFVPSCICPVEKPTVETQNGRPVFRWGGGGVARLCVTELDVECPAGKDDTMPAGMHAYWFVSARGNSCFPQGVQPPVVYGTDDSNNCMFDETDQNGGAKGGTPLTSGKTYRVGLAGFGGSPAYQTFVAP
jgi:hypothetical protein